MSSRENIWPTILNQTHPIFESTMGNTIPIERKQDSLLKGISRRINEVHFIFLHGQRKDRIDPISSEFVALVLVVFRPNPWNTKDTDIQTC